MLWPQWHLEGCPTLTQVDSMTWLWLSIKTELLMKPSLPLEFLIQSHPNQLVHQLSDLPHLCCPNYMHTALQHQETWSWWTSMLQEKSPNHSASDASQDTLETTALIDLTSNCWLWMNSRVLWKTNWPSSMHPQLNLLPPPLEKHTDLEDFQQHNEWTACPHCPPTTTTLLYL